MKNFIKYIKIIKSTYIQEDWSIITKTGKFFLKPAWFVRSILVWIFSPILFLFTLIEIKIRKILRKYQIIKMITSYLYEK